MITTALIRPAPKSQTFKIKTHEVLSFIFAFSAVIFAL